MRRVLAVTPPPPGHWVGDGFPVRSLFSHMSGRNENTPFLMLDYAGPYDFPAATRPRGVGVHPHKGFETVTIVYQGEVEHGDSTGQGGIIREGDVQWMTAARGILHKEFHSHAFTARGGCLEMVQLWVNLPAKHKLAEPGYQGIVAADIPLLALPDGAGSIRLIAGRYGEATGPAGTFTPMNVWDLRLQAGGHCELPLPEGDNVVLAVLAGSLRVNADTRVDGPACIRLARSGGPVSLDAEQDCKLLLLSGEPIDEPVAAYGPFVMNTEQELRTAVHEFHSGAFGVLS